MKLCKKYSMFCIIYCNYHKNHQKMSKKQRILLTTIIKLTNIVTVNAFSVAT